MRVNVRKAVESYEQHIKTFFIIIFIYNSLHNSQRFPLRFSLFPEFSRSFVNNTPAVFMHYYSLSEIWILTP